MKKLIITEGQYIGVKTLMKESFGPEEIAQLKVLIESGDSDNFELAITILEGSLGEDQLLEFIENEYGKLIDILNLQNMAARKIKFYEKSVQGLRNIFNRPTSIIFPKKYNPEFGAELLLLKNVATVIDLRDNKLTKIPSFIYKFNKLKVLWFTDNDITFIPSDIKELNNLGHLTIANDYFWDMEENDEEEFIIFKNRLKELLPNTKIDILQ